MIDTVAIFYELAINVEDLELYSYYNNILRN